MLDMRPVWITPTLLILLPLSLVFGREGRPDRPPLIWKWLSGAIGDAEDSLDTEVTLGDTETVVTRDSNKKLEKLAELGYQATGVYVSPDSVLNPTKWIKLVYDLLPYSKGSTNPEQLTRTVAENYATEAEGGLADKQFGMAVTVVCFFTGMVKSAIPLRFTRKDGICCLGDLDANNECGWMWKCDFVNLMLDSVCGGLGIGKVADTFRSTSCKKDEDCPDIGTSSYVCNIQRGTCEVKIP